MWFTVERRHLDERFRDRLVSYSGSPSMGCGVWQNTLGLKAGRLTILARAWHLTAFLDEYSRQFRLAVRLKYLRLTIKQFQTMSLKKLPFFRGKKHLPKKILFQECSALLFLEINWVNGELVQVYNRIILNRMSIPIALFLVNWIDCRKKTVKQLESSFNFVNLVNVNNFVIFVNFNNSVIFVNFVSDSDQNCFFRLLRPNIRFCPSLFIKIEKSFFRHRTSSCDYAKCS